MRWRLYNAKVMIIKAMMITGIATSQLTVLKNEGGGVGVIVGSVVGVGVAVEVNGVTVNVNLLEVVVCWFASVICTKYV